MSMTAAIYYKQIILGSVYCYMEINFIVKMSIVTYYDLTRICGILWQSVLFNKALRSCFCCFPFFERLGTS